jgi:hypothetical protein
VQTRFARFKFIKVGLFNNVLFLSTYLKNTVDWSENVWTRVYNTFGVESFKNTVHGSLSLTLAKARLHLYKKCNTKTY